MTDKERLEEIKNSHLRGIHSLFGTPWVSIPKENFDWLTQQAERVEELENEYQVRRVELLEEHIERLKEENKNLRVWYHSYHKEAELKNELARQNQRYREALEFYADEKNHEREWDTFADSGVEKSEVMKDGGEKARQALEGEE